MLCGSASAADTSDAFNTEISLNLTVEHPEVLANETPTVIISYLNGTPIAGSHTIIKKGSTGNNTQYQVRFNSTPNNLNLNISVGGHVSKSFNVTVTSDGNNVKHGNATAYLRSYTILMISSSDSYTSAISNAYKTIKNQGYGINFIYYAKEDIDALNNETYLKIKNQAMNADVIIFQMISSPDTVATLKSIVNGSTAKVISVRCGASFLNCSNIDSTDTLKIYWDQGAEENLKRFILSALNNSGMSLKSGENISVIKWPDQWIHHPDAGTDAMFSNWSAYEQWYKTQGKYKNNSSWVAIIAYDSSYKGGNYDIQLNLLKSLEDKGLNAFLVFATSKGRNNSINLFFKDSSNKTRIDALIATVGFNYIYGYPEQSADVFNGLNIPVFAPVYASNLTEWVNNSYGLSKEAYWQIAQPELDGRIEPIVMGGIISMGIDPETGINLKKYVPIADRIERITERVKNWVLLRNLSNTDKKIALIYYNIEGGKDGVSASYLNVISSLSQILKAMKDDGYQVTGNYSEAALEDMILTVGNNVGTWAPGELEKVVNAGAVLIPKEKYLQWFNALPEDLKNEVISAWGPAPGNLMVYNDSIVIPGYMYGNIFVCPQPMRGWSEDPTKIMHSTTLPPSHQYIAFYFWLQNQFKANAVIHLGTHGTLEWLPGKNVGLSGEDWPDILLGNMPNIYPYIVENPGEGTQAKRRGYAVIIDHNIPAMQQVTLYGDLEELTGKISAYDLTTDAALKEQRKIGIVTYIKKLHLDSELKLNLTNASFEDDLDKVEHYLEDLASTLMPYGLHTFGVALNGTVLEQMIDSIVSYDPATRNNTEYRNKLRDALSQNWEMYNLLAALRGEYITPDLAGGPVTKPDVLPTGMNFYSFDPRMAPDSAAWEIGKKLADDLIATYYAENGCYPDKVGVVLWSIETMRTNGQSIAMILRLMGLEPVWKSGRFDSVKVTPLSELSRPRVDVHITISGLFRDHFSYTIDLLDDAFLKVMTLNESTSDNFARKHFLNDTAKYIAMGMSQKDAEYYASARIFGPDAQSYGTGISNLVPTTTAWDSQEDFVDTFLARMSYIYGRNRYSQSALEAFKTSLSQIDATVQVRDGLYGLLDNDDVYQYLGGTTLAASYLSGKDVSVYIANTRNSPKIESLDVFMGTELRSRLFNPKWAEGMLNEGFSGAHEIADHVANMVGWAAVSDTAVKDWMWKEVADMYILDSGMRNQLLATNPQAFKSLTAWVLVAANKGLWNADQATLTAVANEYVKATAEYGVTCCHHTCANIEFNKWVAKVSSASAQTLAAYAKVMKEATGQDVGVSPSTPSNPSQGGSSNSNKDTSSESKASDSVSEVSESTASETAGESLDSNQKAYEVSKSTQGASQESGVSLYAILGILCLIGMVGAGYYLGPKQRK